MKSKISIFFISSFVCVAFWSHAAVHENFKERSGSYIQEVAHKAKHLSKYNQKRRLSAIHELEKKIKNKRKKHVGRVQNELSNRDKKGVEVSRAQGVSLDLQDIVTEQNHRIESWREFIENNDIFAKRQDLENKTTIQYILEKNSKELLQLLFEVAKTKGFHFEKALQEHIKAYMESLLVTE